MTEIRSEHVEWAVVDRLRKMLDEPPETEFNVTQTYALFSAILCWTLQHMRIPKREIATEGDRASAGLRRKLAARSISDDPLQILTTERVVRGVTVPAPIGFEGHDTIRLLKNLRDAMAHGDRRTVEPFHAASRSADRALIGFSFHCVERDGEEIRWSGKITLLEGDMRRIGSAIGGLYCDAVSGSEESFQGDADRHVKERAA